MIGMRNTIAIKSPVNSNIEIKKVDKTIQTTTKAWLGGTNEQMYTHPYALPMLYTSRPTNTSVLYCIKY